jgi:hypothetical protein
MNVVDSLDATMANVDLESDALERHVAMYVCGRERC